MSTYIVQCPKCGAELEADDMFIGRKVACGVCDTTFELGKYYKQGKVLPPHLDIKDNPSPDIKTGEKDSLAKTPEEDDSDDSFINVFDTPIDTQKNSSTTGATAAAHDRPASQGETGPETIDDDSDYFPAYPFNKIPLTRDDLSPTRIINRGQSYYAETWDDVFIIIMKDIVKQHPQIHAETSKLISGIIKKPLFSIDREDLQIPFMIRDGLFLETNFPRRMIFRIIRCIALFYQFPIWDYIIDCKREERSQDFTAAQEEKVSETKADQLNTGKVTKRFSDITDKCRQILNTHFGRHFRYDTLMEYAYFRNFYSKSFKEECPLSNEEIKTLIREIISRDMEEDMRRTSADEFANNADTGKESILDDEIAEDTTEDDETAEGDFVEEEERLNTQIVYLDKLIYNCTNLMPVQIIYKDSFRPVESWEDLFISIIKDFLKIHPSLPSRTKEQILNIFKQALFADNQASLQKPFMVRDGLFLETGFNRRKCLQIIQFLAKIYHFPITRYEIECMNEDDWERFKNPLGAAGEESEGAGISPEESSADELPDDNTSDTDRETPDDGNAFQNAQATKEVNKNQSDNTKASQTQSEPAADNPRKKSFDTDDSDYSIISVFDTPIGMTGNSSTISSPVTSNESHIDIAGGNSDSLVYLFNKNEIPNLEYTKPLLLTTPGLVLHCKSWNQLLVDTMTFLWRNYQKELRAIIDIKPDFCQSLILSSDEQHLRSPKKLGNDVYLETNFSAHRILKVIVGLHYVCGIDLKQCKLSYCQSNNKPRATKEKMQETIHATEQAKPDLFAEIPNIFAEKCRIIFEQFFAEGLRLGSFIHHNKFKNKFKEQFDMDLPDSIFNQIDSICRQYGFEIEGILFPLQQHKIEKLKEIINQLLESGNHQFFFKSVFDSFRIALCDIGIDSPEILSGALKQVFPEYIFDKTFFRTSKDVNAKSEILRILSNGDIMNVDEISDSLGGIPEATIRQICSTSPEILKCKMGYLLISSLNFDDNELTNAKQILDDKIHNQHFALLSDIPINHSEMLNSDSIDNDSLRKAMIYKYFSDCFSCRCSVISLIKDKLSPSELIADFFRSKDAFTFGEGNNFCNLIQSYQGGLWVGIAQKNTIQIDEKNFVSFSKIHFDVERCDNSINEFFTGNMLNLHSISNFINFPSIDGYRWTIQLLASFLRHFSHEFRLLEPAANCKGCGIILKKQHPDISFFKAAATLAVLEKISPNIQSIGDWIINNNLGASGIFVGMI